MNSVLHRLDGLTTQEVILLQELTLNFQQQKVIINEKKYLVHLWCLNMKTRKDY